MASGNTPQTHTEIAATAPKLALTVTQPATISSLLDTLNLIDQMSERIGEDRSGDLGGGGSAQQGTGGAGATKAISPRDQAIAQLPGQQEMQRKLTENIRVEVRQLRRNIRSIPASGRPGAAFELNKIYARIRMLNRLLSTIVEASFDIIKRLFIRVFIDEQPVL